MNAFKSSVSSFRYERKYFLSQLTKYDVECIVKLNPAMFTEVYHQRYINNIYFDTHGFWNYNDNLEGATQRLKVRIRWYGSLFGQIERPILELKIKQGLLGKKISLPLAGFYFSEATDIFSIIEPIAQVQDEIGIDFRSLTPTLLNRYSRKYFESYDRHARVTIDTNQAFYNIKSKENSFIDMRRDNTGIILELKYDQKYASEIQYITNRFPFRITKSSKYVTGLQKVFGVSTFGSR
jgi:SPX domain protein involved in polyphosphate accumulation